MLYCRLYWIGFHWSPCIKCSWQAVQTRLLGTGINTVLWLFCSSRQIGESEYPASLSRPRGPTTASDSGLGSTDASVVEEALDKCGTMAPVVPLVPQTVNQTIFSYV